MINNKVARIVDKALLGNGLNNDELTLLFSVELFSDEAFHIMHAARKYSEEASDCLAEVHAQVGVNVSPCPKNCEFCSFAVINGIFKQKIDFPVEDVIAKSKSLEAQGANAIYLMATANYSFEKFLEIGKTVRRELNHDTVLVSNYGDINYQQALSLKEAGFSGIYHALRLGEGVKTGLDPKLRLKTFEAAKAAGLIIGTCVEPVGPEHSIEELVEKTLVTQAIEPAFSGAARRIPIPNTELYELGTVSEARMAFILAVVRLAMKKSTKGNCTHEPNVIGATAGANLLWAEEGANPRDIEAETSKNRGFDVTKCRGIYQEAEWKFLEGPSRFYSR